MYLSDIYTITGDLAGIPCMSVPCGKTAEGLPVGMQILARHFDEPSMFRWRTLSSAPAVSPAN
jgi:aspartyl-tRNA(Asn)/glutamyl-tRNA(Gln) amidotransferase subunit A